MYKTDYCGDLRASDEGREVTLAGWVHRRRDHGGLIFVDLRDSRGLVQVVFLPEEAEAHAVAERGARRVRAAGERRRAAAPRRHRERESRPGQIEVRATSATVLNAAKTPPFYINDESEPGEVARLKYRYLDLRRERMRNNIFLRATGREVHPRLSHRQRIHRDRDAGAGEPDAGGRARLPGAEPRASRATSTRCRSRRSSSSSC